ncbi:MAG: hypothetical protein ACTJLM_05360 [Ehrlichia sp.]
MKFNRKLIIVPSVIFALLSSLYVGIWLVIATQVKATISKSFTHINIAYDGHIEITGFPFIPKIKVLNVKINPPSSNLDIAIPSLSIEYHILDNILEILGSDLTLMLKNLVKITKDSPVNMLHCKLNDKFRLSVKPAENLLLSLLKNKSERRAYFTSLVYEDGGISCNGNNNTIEKSLLSIETNELKSLDNLLIKLQYKINAQILGNVNTNMNLIIKNTVMTLIMSDIEFKQIDVDVDNISLKLKDSLASAYGRLSLPLSVDSKIDDGELTIEISNYKSFIKRLIETFYSKSKHNDKFHSALQEYIYTISKKKVVIVLFYQ